MGLTTQWFLWKGGAHRLPDLVERSETTEVFRAIPVAEHLAIWPANAAQDIDMVSVAEQLAEATNDTVASFSIIGGYVLSYSLFAGREGEVDSYVSDPEILGIDGPVNGQPAVLANAFGAAARTPLVADVLLAPPAGALDEPDVSTRLAALLHALELPSWLAPLSVDEAVERGAIAVHLQ